MKRNLIVEEWLSLDGYVVDKTGRPEFFAQHVRESCTTAERLELLNGHR